MSCGIPLALFLRLGLNFLSFFFESHPSGHRTHYFSISPASILLWAFTCYSEGHQFESIVRCQSYQARRLVAVDSLPTRRNTIIRNRIYISCD